MMGHENVLIEERLCQYSLLLFIVVYSRILIGREPTLNFLYFCRGVST